MFTRLWRRAPRPENATAIMERDPRDLAAAAGENIRRLRLARGLSQERLGELSGVDFKYVGAIERGEANFTIGILERLARALGVEPSELLAPAPDAAAAATAARATKARSKKDLYALIERLDDRSALFVRDVVATYLGHAEKPRRPGRKKP